MGYEVDYTAGERAGCSSELIIADRIFYVKHFATSAVKIFLRGPKRHYSKRDF